MTLSIPLYWGWITFAVENQVILTHPYSARQLIKSVLFYCDNMYDLVEKEIKEMDKIRML